MQLGTAGRNAAVDSITALINVGSTYAGGRIVLATGSDVAVATLIMSATSFGAASSGTATANSITNDSSAVGGTATRCLIQNRSGSEIMRGSVGTSGTDIVMSTNVIPAGAIVSISSLTLTQAAGTAPA